MVSRLKEKMLKSAEVERARIAPRVDFSRAHPYGTRPCLPHNMKVQASPDLDFAFSDLRNLRKCEFRLPQTTKWEKCVLEICDSGGQSTLRGVGVMCLRFPGGVDKSVGSTKVQVQVQASPELDFTFSDLRNLKMRIQASPDHEMGKVRFPKFEIQ